KDIPGYRFVETKKLPNGDIEHVYEKVKTPTPTPAPTPTPVVEKSTTWVDENGNPLKQTEKGTKDPGSIPGYELVKTVVDKDGNVQHIFRKVMTPNQPVTPAKPEQPETPVKPEQPAKPEVPATPAPQEKVVRQELPQTGTGNEAAVFGVAASAILAGLGMMAPAKKKQDEE
ncbi:LPXTG cell wall anchor domain-containing protein, partial [Granulicatella elegans]|uniref:LPXTG cell wall anchor domain-containing protein n=1 Tax=Granulicatella elegans TaxID=137732 RepID=UPI0028D432F9